MWALLSFVWMGNMILFHKWAFCVFPEKKHCLWRSGTHWWGVWMAEWPWGWSSISSEYHLSTRIEIRQKSSSLKQTFLFQEDLKKKAAIEEKTEDANEEKPKGIPEFWLTIFRSVDMLSDMLQVNQQNIKYSTETFSSVDFAILFRVMVISYFLLPCNLVQTICNYIMWMWIQLCIY